MPFSLLARVFCRLLAVTLAAETSPIAGTVIFPSGRTLTLRLRSFSPHTEIMSVSPSPMMYSPAIAASGANISARTIRMRFPVFIVLPSQTA